MKKKRIWDERKEDREDGDPYAFQVITEDTPEQTRALTSSSTTTSNTAWATS